MATLHINKTIAEKVNQDDLVRLLEAVMDEEMQKSDAEMDCDLIDECADALLEIRRDRDHLAVLVPIMQDKAFLRVIQRKAGSSTRMNGAARGVLIAAAILASTVTVNAMVDAAFDVNILKQIGKAITATVHQKAPEIMEGEDDEDEPTTPVTTNKTESVTGSASTGEQERTTANSGETTSRTQESTTVASVENTTRPQPTTETTTQIETTTNQVTGGNIHHKPTSPNTPEETTKKTRVVGFNAQLHSDFRYHYIYGEQLSYQGLTLTADWSDGTTAQVALRDCDYTTKVNMYRTADVTLSILYKGFLVEIPITVRPTEETRISTICHSERYDYLLCKAGAYVTAYRGTAKELICNVVDGNRIFAIADEVFRKHTELITVELPYVTYVGAKAFAGCTALTQAELPKLQQLGEEAFAGCKALAEAETGDSLTHIGRRAFAETALQRLRLGKGVTVIPEGLCNDCTQLESVRLQGQVTEIGSWAFEGCGRLKTVTGTEHLRRVGDYAFSDCQAVTFAFPAQLEVAGENAFYFCRQLQIGALPQSIKSIGKRAFAYCPGLTEVRLPSGIAVVPQEAFRATNAKTIVLPEGVERIESGAFESCKATSVTVPGSVRYIGKRGLYSVLLRSIDFHCLSPALEAEAIYSSKQVVIRCYLGTTPYQYAKAHKMIIELKQTLPELLPGIDD